jgi:hypothetical protein
MKGDLVNGLAFLSTVPWYYYLAITSYYDDIRQLQATTTRHDDPQFPEYETILQSRNDEGGLIPSSRFPQHVVQQSCVTTKLFDDFAGVCQTGDDDHDTNIIVVDRISPKCNVETTGSSTDVTDANRHNSDLVFNDKYLKTSSVRTTNNTQRFLVCIMFTIAGILGGLSWYYQSNNVSALSCVVSMIAIMTMNLCQWPFPNEPTMIAQFFWYLLTLSANTPLSLSYQVSLAIFGLFGAVFVVNNISCYEVNDILPIIVGVASKLYLRIVSIQVLQSLRSSLTVSCPLPQRYIS